MVDVSHTGLDLQSLWAVLDFLYTGQLQTYHSREGLVKAARDLNIPSLIQELKSANRSLVIKTNSQAENSKGSEVSTPYPSKSTLQHDTFLSCTRYSSPDVSDDDHRGNDVTAPIRNHSNQKATRSNSMTSGSLHPETNISPADSLLVKQEASSENQSKSQGNGQKESKKNVIGTIELQAVKRGRGRPRKDGIKSSKDISNDIRDVQTPNKSRNIKSATNGVSGITKRGRPRKSTEIPVVRKRGRSRKYDSVQTEIRKRCGPVRKFRSVLRKQFPNLELKTAVILLDDIG